MEHFNLDERLKLIYSSFPEAKAQAIIGITCNYDDGKAMIMDRYYQQVVAAGGVPVLIPPVADAGVLVNTLAHIDALVLSGGADVNPLWMGEEPSRHLHHINRQRDLAELMLVRLAFNRQLPILGICRGIQLLTAALGGKVEQDIAHNTENILHSQDADRSEPTHSVNIEGNCILSRIYNLDPAKGGRIMVNSFHHQAVKEAGERLRVTATAPDGIIEAVESTEHKPIMGVQWHPEWLEADGLPIFQWLVNEARLFAQAKATHNHILTLDSHCDTPMFFPQGVDFGQRDPRILYDLHKMTDGHQDATIMVAYLPQPKMGETFSQKVDIEGIIRHNPQLKGVDMQLTPKRYADIIFDKLEEIVDEHADYISLARTPAELYEDKRRRRKSIVFGIENGLALEHDLANIRHFAQRGVVYITLCHNGDNDICDSARGCNTHNGVSSFGRKVIAEMNRQGVMVDLSHAAEKSFYDAIQLSECPIVVSHACCRALCDHPRNLTDEQMRALAASGGVMQITFYKGFLVKNGKADITDAIRHIEHAIDIMGIDHVGIGSDFDGDGGVRGLADASELINLTRALLRRHYSEQDIAKLWGGNWLRIMAQAQRLKA